MGFSHELIFDSILNKSLEIAFRQKKLCRNNKKRVTFDIYHDMILQQIKLFIMLKVRKKFYIFVFHCYMSKQVIRFTFPLASWKVLMKPNLSYIIRSSVLIEYIAQFLMSLLQYKRSMILNYRSCAFIYQ